MFHAFTHSYLQRCGLSLFTCMGLISACCVPAGSQAVELYRCTLNGQVEFRQTPCPEGEQERTQVIEQSSGMTPAKPGLKLPRPKQRKRVKSENSVDEQPKMERCWKTEKKLEQVERHLRAGYSASEYERLHQKQDEYEGYLDRFCSP